MSIFPKNVYNILHNLRAMKKVILLLPLLLLLMLLFMAGSAEAAAYFLITDVSPIHVAQNSEANFTVTVKGLGPQGEYVQLIFRNLTPGLSITYAGGGYRYVLPTGTRTYNCSIKAGNVAPGNYSFDIGIFAQEAKTNWRRTYVIVEPAGTAPAAPEEIAPQMANVSANASMNISAAPVTNKTEAAPEAKKSPGPGVPIAIATMILLLAVKRRG